jgi:hypothetical protein
MDKCNKANMAIGYYLWLFFPMATRYGYWLLTMDIYTMGYYAYNYWLWIKVLAIAYHLWLLAIGYFRV